MGAVSQEFGVELIVDASVSKVQDEYILKMSVQSILRKDPVEEKTETCRNCTISDRLKILKLMGAGKTVSDHWQPTLSESSNSATLVFDSYPSDASVYINGQNVGVTPYRGVGYDIGQDLEIEIRKFGYRAFHKTIMLNQRIRKFNTPFELIKKQGQLEITTDPYKSNATVFINDKLRGSSDNTLISPVGEIEIYAIADGKQSEVITTSLLDGETKNITLVFVDEEVTNDPVFVFTKPQGSKLVFKGKSKKGFETGQVDLYLKEGSNKFTLKLDNGRSIYGDLQLTFIDQKVKEQIFGLNEALPKPRHIQASMRGSPVKYRIKMNTDSGAKEVINYRLSLRPI